jgi:hypothetical protein
VGPNIFAVVVGVKKKPVYFWIYLTMTTVDNFGGVFKGEEDHLCMDFNTTTALEILPRNWVDKLIFDYFYLEMKTESEILQSWKAILHIDSEICFEHGASSIRINEGLGVMSILVFLLFY